MGGYNFQGLPSLFRLQEFLKDRQDHQSLKSKFSLSIISDKDYYLGGNRLFKHLLKLAYFYKSTIYLPPIINPDNHILRLLCHRQQCLMRLNNIKMNRIFGFFKEKLIEAKQQNQNQIQNIINALEFEAYSPQKMLTLLQDIKTNYLEWNILIANEASTGLYYSQLHNKNCALKKIKLGKEITGRIEKNSIVLEQMEKTLEQLKGVEKLSSKWTTEMNRKVQKLDLILSQRKIQQRQQKKQANSIKIVEQKQQEGPTNSLLEDSKQTQQLKTSVQENNIKQASNPDQNSQQIYP